jgi:hypothetical protein
MDMELRGLAAPTTEQPQFSEPTTFPSSNPNTNPPLSDSINPVTVNPANPSPNDPGAISLRDVLLPGSTEPGNSNIEPPDETPAATPEPPPAITTAPPISNQTKNQQTPGNLAIPASMTLGSHPPVRTAPLAVAQPNTKSVSGSRNPQSAKAGEAIGPLDASQISNLF